MTSVSVIIPVLNGWHLTRDCLCALAEHSSRSDSGSLRVIVVDNGSTDETPHACPVLGRELFQQRFSWLRLERNIHFGPACNHAARCADTDMLLFLNNDTRVLEGWLPPLIGAMEAEPDLAGVGPLLLFPDGTVQHLGIAIWPAGTTLRHLYRCIRSDHPLAARRRSFRALTAAALLLRREDFLQAGGFHEGYINGFEDVDLCLQLTRSGRRMTVIPESRVIHLESQTPTRHDRNTDNGHLLRRRFNLSECADLEVLLAEDGYVPFVSPDFQITVGLPDARKMDMLRRLRRRPLVDTEWCLSLLEEEPYWEDGYLLLAGYLEKGGKWKEALDICYRALLLVPTFELCSRMLHIAGRAGIELPALREAHMQSCAFIRDERQYLARLDFFRETFRAGENRDMSDAFEKAALKAQELRTHEADERC